LWGRDIELGEVLPLLGHGTLYARPRATSTWSMIGEEQARDQELRAGKLVSLMQPEMREW
jgi:hypothetical protein